MAAQLGLAWCTRIVGWARGSCVLLRTAVNFPPPSWALAGAQHMRMLEPMHARSPQTAPIAPAHPAPKPIIEKRELPQVCAVHEKKEHANAVHVQCVRRRSCCTTAGKHMAVPPCLYGAYLFRAVLPRPRMCRAQPNCACAPGLAHKTKHAMTKHLALFASLGRLTLSLHISGHPLCRVVASFRRSLGVSREVNQQQLDTAT